MKKIFAFVAIGFLTSCAELQQVLLETASNPTVGLSNLDIANGLKEALTKGVDEEVSKLTKADGFLKNEAVKIMLPSELTTMDERLRSMGLGYLPDKGMELLNRAAEDAVKEATPIFISAIKNMSFADARNILMGHDSSATNYLRNTTSDSLYNKFYPVVESSLSKVGADEAWNSVTSKYNSIPFVTKVNPDLKDYVTLKALDGVFKMITIEEKDIRNDLGARSSDLLKRVFALQDNKQ
jgi:hypothetical protein